MERNKRYEVRLSLPMKIMGTSEVDAVMTAKKILSMTLLSCGEIKFVSIREAEFEEDAE